MARTVDTTKLVLEASDRTRQRLTNGKKRKRFGEGELIWAADVSAKTVLDLLAEQGYKIVKEENNPQEGSNQ